MADFPFENAAWQQEDADWEAAQSAGLQALSMGDEKAGTEAIARALQVARKHFQPGDPRLAASLASHASVLSRRDDPLASKLFTEALEHWDSFGTWLDRQPMPKLARSSMFHLRLEAKHRGAYPNETYRRCLTLAVWGREITKALAEHGQVICEAPARHWHEASSKKFDVLRKVAAAVQLIAS